MSSSPPSRPRSRWSPPAWSLRARLLAAVVALIAVVCLGIGVVTTLALRQVLLEQKDRELTAAAMRLGGGPGGPGAPPPRSGHGDEFRGLPPGTLLARVVNGTVTSATTFDPDAASGEHEVPTAQWATLAALPADNVARGIDLGELGGYRVIAREHDGAVVVTGLPTEDVEDTVWVMVAAESAIAGLGLLLATGAVTLVIRRSLRPLRRVAATASRVAELPLDRGEVALSVRVPDTDTDPRTEVGQVGAALNRMLGHVAAALAARQASETRVRQFVADASHELRTPLAAIRGYAELTRRRPDEVPSDIAHALRRVESESARMTTLVDDMLLLARLDSGRALETRPVDMSALVIDAVSDAHVAAPDHKWQLDLPDDAVLVAGDAARLHQVLSNLLRNAGTHTPPGTVVRTGLSNVGDEVELTITDNGPGIPVELQPEVFERFARGDTSRSRSVGGTGLGLAIVAAVVEAHGGTVAVCGTPGETRFTVRLAAFTGAA